MSIYIEYVYKANHRCFLNILEKGDHIYKACLLYLCLFLFCFFSVAHILMKLKSMSSCQCNLVYMQCIGELILEQIKKGPSSAVLAFPKFIDSLFYGQSIMILWFVEEILLFVWKRSLEPCLNTTFIVLLFNKQCLLCACIYDDITYLPVMIFNHNHTT